MVDDGTPFLLGERPIIDGLSLEVWKAVDAALKDELQSNKPDQRERLWLCIETVTTSNDVKAVDSAFEGLCSTIYSVLPKSAFTALKDYFLEEIATRRRNGLSFQQFKFKREGKFPPNLRVVACDDTWIDLVRRAVTMPQRMLVLTQASEIAGILKGLERTPNHQPAAAATPAAAAATAATPTSTQVQSFLGDTGSGKSTLTLLTACELGCPCFYFTSKDEVMQHATDAAANTPEGTNRTARKSIIDAATADSITEVIKLLVGDHTNASGTDRIVVIFDEAHGHPEFLRSLCRVRNKVAQGICDIFSNAEKLIVNFIVAGSGLGGANFDLSSEPSSYRTHFAAPMLRETMLQYMPLAAQNVIRAGSAIGRNAWFMMSNARAAALLWNEIGDQYNRNLHFNPVQEVSGAVFRAAHYFKSLNGSSEDTVRRYLTNVLYCIAAQELPEMEARAFPATAPRGKLPRAPTLPISIFYEIGLSKGMLVDRAVQHGAELTLDRKFNGVRYHLPEAQMAVAVSLLQMEHVSVSGEGFEQAIADYLQIAILMAQARLLEQVGAENRTDRNGWREPKALWFELEKWLHGETPSTDFAESTRGTKCVTMAHQFQNGTAFTEELNGVCQNFLKRVPFDRKCLRCESAVENRTHSCKVCKAEASFRRFDLVVLSAPKSKFADLTCFIRSETDPSRIVVLLVQCKRYLSAPMNGYEIFQELHKMGHRDLRSVWAATVSLFSENKSLRHSAVSALNANAALSLFLETSGSLAGLKPRWSKAFGCPTEAAALCLLCALDPTVPQHVAEAQIDSVIREALDELIVTKDPSQPEVMHFVLRQIFTVLPVKKLLAVKKVGRRISAPNRGKINETVNRALQQSTNANPAAIDVTVQQVLKMITTGCPETIDEPVAAVIKIIGETNRPSDGAADLAAEVQSLLQPHAAIEEMTRTLPSPQFKFIFTTFGATPTVTVGVPDDVLLLHSAADPPNANSPVTGYYPVSISTEDTAGGKRPFCEGLEVHYKREREAVGSAEEAVGAAAPRQPRPK